MYSTRNSCLSIRDLVSRNTQLLYLVACGQPRRPSIACAQDQTLVTRPLSLRRWGHCRRRRARSVDGAGNVERFDGICVHRVLAVRSISVSAQFIPLGSFWAIYMPLVREMAQDDSIDVRNVHTEVNFLCRQVLENARRRSCEGLALPFLLNWLLGMFRFHRTLSHFSK